MSVIVKLVYCETMATTADNKHERKWSKPANKFLIFLFEKNSVWHGLLSKLMLHIN